VEDEWDERKRDECDRRSYSDTPLTLTKASRGSWIASGGRILRIDAWKGLEDLSASLSAMPGLA